MYDRIIMRCKNIFTGKTGEIVDGYIVVNGKYIEKVVSKENKGEINFAKAEELRFDDCFIMAGFHDFHVHLLLGAMVEYGGVLRYAASEEEAAKILYDHSLKEKSKWILGGAWDHFRWQGQRLPHKSTLDNYFPNQRVFSVNKECHSAWLNSAALAYFGLNRDTPDPPNGKLERDEHGELTGHVFEAAMMTLLEKIFAEFTDEEVAKFTKAYMKTANALGITSVADVAIKNSIRESAYQLLDERGQLTMRIHFSQPMMTDLQQLKEMEKRFGGEMVRFIGVKDFIDGTPMGHSGYMLEGYTDRPDFRSEPLISPELLFSRVAELHQENIKVRLHACGDAGVRLCLDAFAHAVKLHGKKDLRHCIEHIESTTAQDIQWFNQLNLIASVQPEHLPKYNFYHHPFFSMIGEERMQFSWPFATLKKSGAVLAFGTDYPVADMSPFRGLFRAVTRLTNDDEPEGGFNPPERLSIEESLQAYTLGSAYAANRENELGSIESGKYADLIVLEENLFACAADLDVMKEIKPLMTMVNGEVVYER